MKTETEFRQWVLERCNSFLWFDESPNPAAYAALQDVYAKMQEMRPDNVYCGGQLHNHFSYVRSLTIIMKALTARQYSRACYELGSLAHAEPILQPRIFYNLLSVLERYGGITGGTVQKKENQESGE